MAQVAEKEVDYVRMMNAGQVSFEIDKSMLKGRQHPIQLFEYSNRFGLAVVGTQQGTFDLAPGCSFITVLIWDRA